MELEDIPQVLEVDRESYTVPWPSSAYRREILHNRNARYVVLREIQSSGRPARSVDAEARNRLPFFPWARRTDPDPARTGRILGYAGMWLMVDEAHITTIAMRSSWRGRGLGELLLATLVDQAFDLGAHRVTLEVRVSNEPAQSLYRKYGFRQEGVRPRYYSDNNEDAYIMSTSSIQSGDYRTMFEGLVGRLRFRLGEQLATPVDAPVLNPVRATGPGQSSS
jgi:ribosomal-protein-alanine N-acetyltransferase